MKLKYSDDDFLPVVVGEKTTEQLAKELGVSVNAIRKAMQQRGIYLKKKRIKIITPYMTKVCNSKTEVAQELKISTTMVGMILKGYDKCEIVNQLNIKLEVIE